jgi:tetratricopeptide (TPR) repeat protein
MFSQLTTYSLETASLFPIFGFMKTRILFISVLLAGICFAQVNNDFRNKFMLAQSYEQAGQLDKAKSIYESLYAQQPSNENLFQALNDIYLKLKDYNSSVQLLELKIKDQPDINLYGLLGSTYYLMGNDQKAFETWDKGLSSFPPSEVNYRTIAKYAIERRAFDKAIDYLKKGKDVAQNPMYFSYDLANLYALTMQYKSAADEYCEILSKNPNELTMIEGRILSYADKPDAIAQTINAFENCGSSDNLSFDYLLARLYVENKSYDKALEKYEKIDDKKGNQGAELYDFAETLLSDKQYELSSKVYNQIINKYPNSPLASSAKLGYAKTLEQSVLDQTQTVNWKPFKQVDKENAGKFDDVIKAYQEITKIYPNTEAGYEAYLHIGEIELNNLNKPEDAEIYFKKIVSESPSSSFAPDAYSDLGKVYLLKGNLKESESYYSEILNCAKSDEEDKHDALFNLAQVYFYQNKFEKARGILDTLLENLKDNAANDAIELSFILNTSKNDSSHLVDFADAELLTKQNKFDEAAKKYKLVAENQKAFTLNNICELREAEMELALNNYDKSVKMLEKISNEGQGNIYADKALYLMAQTYQFGLKNVEKAAEAYENLLEKFPNSLYLDDARDQIIKLKNPS